MHIELLKKQADALILVQRHHGVWANEADDPKIRGLYEGIIQYLDETLYYYEELITELQSQLDRR